MQHDIAIPTLPSRCLLNTLAFFERLGFEGQILGADNAYAILRRGTVELHFFLYKDLKPAESSFGCYVRVCDVDKLYQMFSSAHLPRIGIPRMDTVEVKPWGMKEFAIVDIDGNLLRIGQEL